MSQPRVDLVLLLHAHLPFVRMPKHARFLEENWFFEALTESYIPLLLAMDRLADKGIPGRLNLSISMPLLAMWQDPELQRKYSRHLEILLGLADKEIRRYEGDPLRQQLAEFYRARLTTVRDAWEHRYGHDIPGALLRLRDRGRLDLLACIGTHPFLPAWRSDPGSVQLQIAVTVEAFRRFTGAAPQHVWLPECGYFDGLEDVLAQHGIRSFVVETHGVLLATPNPRYGVFEPMRTPSGVVCLGRDQSSSREVWSREVGYPGHPEYREFYRDLCQETDRAYLGDYFFAGNEPIHTGFKYHRITGGDRKEPYRPWMARALALEHARLFVANRSLQGRELGPLMDRTPMVVAPYDAELFGHWWFEGVDFLEAVFEACAMDGGVHLTGVDQVVSGAGKEQHRPAFSSWGEGGYGDVWINGGNDWIYPLCYSMRMQFPMLRRQAKGSRGRRMLAQAAREFMLAQSSDWAFMIRNDSAASYAGARVHGHHAAFQQLVRGIGGAKMPGGWFEDLEARDNIFPWLDAGDLQCLD